MHIFYCVIIKCIHPEYPVLLFDVGYNKPAMFYVKDRADPTNRNWLPFIVETNDRGIRSIWSKILCKYNVCKSVWYLLDPQGYNNDILSNITNYSDTAWIICVDIIMSSVISNSLDIWSQLWHTLPSKSKSRDLYKSIITRSIM